jgi:hypothetical protein
MGGYRIYREKKFLFLSLGISEKNIGFASIRGKTPGVVVMGHGVDVLYVGLVAGLGAPEADGLD